MQVNRCTARYRSLPDKDKKLRERMLKLAEKRKRFGVPRLHILLRDESIVVNHKRTERIYREEKLALRKQKTKKHSVSPRRPVEVISGPDECWAMDFIHDNLADGRAIRILLVYAYKSKHSLPVQSRPL